MQEFRRRVETGEQDVEVVMAIRVPLQRWLRSTIDRFRFVIIEARYLDDATTADLFVTKVRGLAHNAVASEFHRQIGNYARA